MRRQDGEYGQIAGTVCAVGKRKLDVGGFGGTGNQYDVGGHVLDQLFAVQCGVEGVVHLSRVKQAEMHRWNETLAARLFGGGNLHDGAGVGDAAQRCGKACVYIGEKFVFPVFNLVGEGARLYGGSLNGGGGAFAVDGVFGDEQVADAFLFGHFNQCFFPARMVFAQCFRRSVSLSQWGDISA